jgi:hypothetical protein
MSKSKIKVPKRVAGVKIPKAVRKGPVLQFVNSSAGKLLVAEALTAALGLFASRQTRGDKGEKIKLTAREAEDALKRNTARLTFAFGEAVRAFRVALAEPHDESTVIDAETDEPAGTATPPVAKKNYRRAPEAPTQP